MSTRSSLYSRCRSLDDESVSLPNCLLIGECNERDDVILVDVTLSPARELMNSACMVIYLEAGGYVCVPFYRP